MTKPMVLKIAPLNRVFRWIIKSAFPKADLDHMAITFGNEIYTNIPPTEDLLIHEGVHIKQQKGSIFWATIWWIRYILSGAFRYSQELEAYRTQLQYIFTIQKDRNKRSKIKGQIAGFLSSDMYRNMVTYEQALKDLL